MGIRFIAAVGGAVARTWPAPSERASATVLTETGSFSDVVSVANGASITDDIAVPPFNPSLGVLTNTGLTIAATATFSGFANVPSTASGQIALATTTVNYDLAGYASGTISQPFGVQEVCPAPCQGTSPIGTFSQSQTTTVSTANPLALGRPIPVTISSQQQSSGGTIVGTQSITGTATATFTYQPPLTAHDQFVADFNNLVAGYIAPALRYLNSN